MCSVVIQCVSQSDQRTLWIEALKEAAKPPAEPIIPDDVRICITLQKCRVPFCFDIRLALVATLHVFAFVQKCAFILCLTIVYTIVFLTIFDKIEFSSQN
jgi:hypothetical protein